MLIRQLPPLGHLIIDLKKKKKKSHAELFGKIQPFVSPWEQWLLFILCFCLVPRGLVLGRCPDDLYKINSLVPTLEELIAICLVFSLEAGDADGRWRLQISALSLCTKRLFAQLTPPGRNKTPVLLCVNGCWSKKCWFLNVSEEDRSPPKTDPLYFLKAG